MDNPFWEYSCGIYAEGDVATLCLELQDTFGMDVNMILYGAWLGGQGIRLSLEHLHGIEEQVAQWRADIVLPLRALRQELKDLTGSAGSSSAGSYEELKTLELDAERQQQELMYTYYLSHSGADSELEASAPCELANMRLVAQFYCDQAPRWNDIVLRLSHNLTA